MNKAENELASSTCETSRSKAEHRDWSSTETETEPNTNSSDMATAATAATTSGGTAGSSAPGPPTATKTPPRTSYAHSHHHTPIASIKRPRSSLEGCAAASSSGRFMSPGGKPGAAAGGRGGGLSRTGSQADRDSGRCYPQTPQQTQHPVDSVALSPMHPPKPVHRDEDEKERASYDKDEESWVGRKVDELFSPVLNFLHSAETSSGGGDENNKDVHADQDDAMMVVDDQYGVAIGDEDHLPSPSASVSVEKDNSVVIVDTQPTESTDISPAPSGMSNDDDEHVDNAADRRCNAGSSAPSTVHSADSGHFGRGDHRVHDEDESHCDSLQAIQDDIHIDEDEFNPWQFIKSLPDYRYIRHLCPSVALPPKDPKAPDITLVLDLDETLVHCTVDPVENPDLTFPVQFHGMTYTVHVRLRPHLFTFLKKIEGQFEVVVFTASQKVYANELLNLIDPEGKFIHHRLFRESCLAVEGNFLKDLNVLGRDLSKTVLVDNSPHAFGYQVPNGIPIESWFDDPNDRELLKLERFLRQMCTASAEAKSKAGAGKKSSFDVRDKITDKFQCHKLIENATVLPCM